MHKKILIIFLTAALVLIPVAGLAATLTNPESTAVPPSVMQYFAEAAGEMGLTVEQATNLVDQARELKTRMFARQRGMSYEEMRQRFDECREDRENCDRLGPKGRMQMRRGGARLWSEKSGD